MSGYPTFDTWRMVERLRAEREDPGPIRIVPLSDAAADGLGLLIQHTIARQKRREAELSFHFSMLDPDFE